ncbi:hypothetical protein NL463_30555, partial [Klebsiella pneumoniae]|nr:hypothetical protein [Klebsiella pneumoniae]
PEEYERVLGVIKRQAADLARSVDALLFLARSDSDAPPPPTEPMDLREWLPALLAAQAARPRYGDLSFEPGTDGPLRAV